MAKNIKYIGAATTYQELAVTGKQSVWHPGQVEQRSDAEADLLLGTGQFGMVAVGLRGVITTVTPSASDGLPDDTIYFVVPS